MQLNLGTKKNFSEDSMRKIINILVGLMSTVSTLEDQCIKEFSEDVTYAKGQIVIGTDGYFYEARTASQGAWDASKWTKVGTDDFTELSIDDIKAMLGLSQDQIDYLAKLISDDTIVLDHTWSSSKSYTEIQQALNQAKQYCITELAKKSTGSFKIASSTAEVTDGNYLYLIMNPTTSKYDIYALISGNVEKLTTVDVNLDNYLTKTEIETDYLKKTDADSKYATITTVDGKVDKTDIVDNLTSTDTDKPLSANQGKVLKDEVDLKANDSEVVKKTDIVTTIDSSSTNNQVPSASAIYNNPNNKIKKLNSGEGIIEYADTINDEMVTETVEILNIKDSPYGVNNASNDFYYTIYNINNYNFKRIVACDIRKNDRYMMMKRICVWSSWQRVCPTSVADVPKTSITWSDETYFKSNDVISTGNYYQVRNGVCFVNIDIVCTTPKDGGYILPIVLPKPTIDYVHANISSLPNGAYEHSSITIAVAFSGTHVSIYGGIANNRYLGTFSYPVAES